jgi:hypothetical protein
VDKEIQWCVDVQAWAKEHYDQGIRYMAVLGMSDALGEEVLLRLEEESPRGCY